MPAEAPPPPQNSLFCFGYGYSCDYIRHELVENTAAQRGTWSVSGTTRDENKQEKLLNRGIASHLFDIGSPLIEPTDLLENVTHLLISTPPNDDGDPSFLVHKDDILRLKNLKWVGYFSTSGVYGDRGGDWIDETAELRPSSQRGSRRKLAEEQWLSLHKTHNLPVHIFRLPGIYGPGRSALDSIRAGVARRIEKPGHVFNRIHVEDIAQAIIASMTAPSPGKVYNISDDEPAPSHEVISYACRLLGRTESELVAFDHADLAPITRSFYSDNKRIKNDVMKSGLGVSLKYPTYREGLTACLEAENYALSVAQSDTGAGGGAQTPKIFSS
jgi:hypothetical protein